MQPSAVATPLTEPSLICCTTDLKHVEVTVSVIASSCSPTEVKNINVVISVVSVFTMCLGVSSIRTCFQKKQPYRLDAKHCTIILSKGTCQ